MQAQQRQAAEAMVARACVLVDNGMMEEAASLLARAAHAYQQVGVCMYACVCECVCVCVTCVYTSRCMYVHMYLILTNPNSYIYISRCMYVCKHARIYTYVCMYVYIYMYIIYIYIYIYRERERERSALY